MASDRSINEQQRAVSLLTEAVNILRSPVQTAVRDPAAGIVRNTGLPLQTALQTPTPAVNPASNNTVNNAVVSPRSKIDRLFSPY